MSGPKARTRSRTARLPAGKCVTCGAPAVARHRPFCSRRCQEIDLGRWFGESYRIPTDEAPNGDASPPPEEPQE